MYTVYAVYNRDHKKLYIGQTDNLEQRLRLHNEHEFGHSFTARFTGIWELIYSEEYATRAEAMKREQQLKSYQGRQFVKKHIPR